MSNPQRDPLYDNGDIDNEPSAADHERQDAYDEGVDAFDGGKKIEDNPYEGELSMRWSDGWINRRDGAE